MRRPWYAYAQSDMQLSAYGNDALPVVGIELGFPAWLDGAGRTIQHLHIDAERVVVGPSESVRRQDLGGRRRHERVLTLVDDEGRRLIVTITNPAGRIPLDYDTATGASEPGTEERGVDITDTLLTLVHRLTGALDRLHEHVRPVNWDDPDEPEWVAAWLEADEAREAGVRLIARTGRR